MLGNKEDNKVAKKAICHRFSLFEKSRSQAKGNGAEMTVNPIFSARSFKSKDEYCFVLMPFTMEWSDRVVEAYKEDRTGNRKKD